MVICVLVVERFVGGKHDLKYAGPDFSNHSIQQKTYLLSFCSTSLHMLAEPAFVVRADPSGQRHSGEYWVVALSIIIRWRQAGGGGVAGPVAGRCFLSRVT